MARIRTIKPEFQQSESMGRVSRDARLLFVQLWTFADDSGRARAASRMLASVLFPFDDDAPSLIEGWLTELEREDCIFRYTIDGTTYLQVKNWEKHQKIDKPSPSRIPPSRPNSETSANPLEPSLNIREPSITDLVPSTVGPIANDLPSLSTTWEGEGLFERFWSEYPRGPTASRPKTLVAWKETPVADRPMAIAFLPAFRARPTTHPTSPDRYLRDKMYLNGHCVADSARSGVKIERLSPEGEAWERHYRAEHGKGAPWASGIWYFPSKLPPGIQQETTQ